MAQSARAGATAEVGVITAGAHGPLNLVTECASVGSEASVYVRGIGVRGVP
jgi:hypothetical protein